MADDLAKLMQDVERDDVFSMRRVAEIVTARHGHRIEYRSEAELASRGVAAYFVWPKGPIVVPPITNSKGLAVVIHEDGHGVAGKCSGREPHRRDPRVRDWWHCIACETAAWQAALDAVPFFTWPMFQRLQDSLGTYRAMTPASPAALAELDRLRSFVRTFAAPKNARVQMQLCQEFVNLWRDEVQDARRPRPGSLDDYRARLARAM